MNNPREQIINCNFRKSNPLKILTAYGPHLKCTLSFPPEEGRTKQSFRDECDINVIMKRYEATGVLPEMRDQRNAQFIDTTGYDYQRAMDIIADARSAFQDLPARIRDRFENDPAQLLDFVQDPENRDEAAELGLLTDAAVAALEAARAKAAAPPVPPAAPAAPAAEKKP